MTKLRLDDACTRKSGTGRGHKQSQRKNQRRGLVGGLRPRNRVGKVAAPATIFCRVSAGGRTLIAAGEGFRY